MNKMSDRNKTKAQLLDELAELRQEVARLKAVEANCLELLSADDQNLPAQKPLTETDLWFSLSLDMLCIAGTDGYFKQLNPAFEKTLGWTTAELQASPFLDFVHPDDIPATLAEVEKLAQGEPTIYFENRYRCRDGSYKWLAWTAQPTPTGTLYAIARDITRQKQSETALDRRLRGLDSLNRIGREIAETPAISDLLEWTAAHIPPATQYPELCKAAIEYNNQLYGAAEVVELPNQITNALWVAGQSVGRIYLAYTEKYDFLDEESALLGGIASRISAYIENRRLVEQLQEQAAALRESEQRYQQILDAITDMVLVKGPHSRILWANKAFRDCYGMTNEQLHDLIDAPFVEPDYTQQYIKDDAYVFNSGQVLNIPEEPVTRHDGQVLTVHTVKSPIFDAEGKIVMTVGVSRDVTERKQTEQVIIRQAEFLSKVIENLPVGLFAKNVQADYRFSIWNAKMEELFGNKRQDMLGKNDYDFFGQEEADYYRRTDEAVMKGGQIVDIPLEQVTASRGIIWAHTIKVPIYDNQGNPDTLLGILEDISERKQAEQALAKRATEFETVAQVSTAVATILETNQLLQEVVDLTKERFGLYHAHIYLLNEPGDTLNLAAGAGEVGRKMIAQGWRIPLAREHSLVAQAARTRRGVTVNDVRENPDFLPNPLLPETRAEMAIPIMIGEQVLGVLDVQADVVGYFTQEEIRIKSVLAGQIAVALRNAELYQQTETALAQTEALYKGGDRVIRATTLDETLLTLVEATAFQRLDRVTLLFFDRAWTDEPPTLMTPMALWERDNEHPLIPPGTSYTLAQFPIIGLFSRNEPTILGDITADKRADENTRAFFLEELGMRSLVVFPLVAGGQWIGVITGQGQTTLLLDEAEIRQINSLTDQAATVIQNQRLFTQTQEALTEARILYETSQALAVATNLDEALQSVLLTLRQNEIADGADSVTLTTIEVDDNGEPDWTEIIAWWFADGREAPYPLGTRFPLKQLPLTALWVKDPSNPLIFSDTRTDERLDEQTRGWYVQAGTLASILMPLSLAGRWVGLLSISWTKPHTFSEQDQRIYQALMRQFATAVDNQRLVQQTQEALARVQQSQELLRSVIDATPDWIFVKDQEHRYRLVNQGFARAMHRLPDDFIGKDDLEMGFPEEIVKGDPAKGIRGFWADDRQVMDSGEPLVNPHVPVILAGETHAFHDIKTPLRDAAGNIWGVLGFGRDVTELQRIQEALQESQERSQTILESVSVAMLISRVSDGTILYANAPLAEMVVKPLEELIDQHTPDFYVNVADRQTVVDRIQHQGYVNNYELQLKRSNGELFWALLTARLFNFRGENAIITTLIDITDRKQAEEKLRANQERLAEALTVARLGNWEFDVLTQMFTFNDQFYTLFRTTAEQEGGYLMPAMQYAQKFVHPDDAYMVGAEIKKAIETADPNYSDQIEHRIIRADGSEGYILVRFRVIKDEQGRTVKTVGANQDITERKLADLEREYLLAENEATYRQFVQREWAQFLGEQHGGRWHIEHHRAGSVGEQDGNGHNSAAISEPIRLRGQTIGNVKLEDIDPTRQWTAEEKALVETISEQLAQTIENLRLFNETQKRASREQLTREITDKMRASPDIDAVIETGLTELAKILNVPRTYVKLTTKAEAAQDGNGENHGANR
jgi:PAS domain S-box-containing protein